jgi:anti-sigma regulatory factor (Ser/Thr protein kinase)
VSDTLVVRSDLVSFLAVRVWAERVCCDRLHDAAPDAVAAVVLALHEAVRNVVEHAYEGASGAIELCAEASGRTLVLSVVHDGVSFDRAAVREPSFDGTRESGFGLLLLEKVVDRVEYGRTPEGRGLVRLEKRFPETRVRLEE